jgi:DNA-binding CsgD family transcriptional regulator
VSLPRLIGRRREIHQLDELLDTMRAGRSRTLVLRGEPGIGKTALLEELADRAGECTILRTAGVQAEMELAFAGLHQLLTPILSHLEDLPAPQRDALETAFGISNGPAPDRFFIALAVLNMLALASVRASVLCLIDDEQWLDRATTQILSFVARRLDADPVALVFASRATSDDFSTITEMIVEGLAAEDADALLDTAISGPLDPQIRAQIVHEVCGNPLALLELPRSVSPVELAGGFGFPKAMTLPRRIEESFLRRLEALPKSSQRLLQLAAADPVGDPTVIWKAASSLDIDLGAVQAVVDSGLMDVGTRIQFRHPLVRSAAYHSAAPSHRNIIHDALARATDPTHDPDRHAWHRAQAAASPDEDVAAELEHSATRAYRRGGFAAAAAFLEHSAMLTPSSSPRVRRMIAAARAKRDAGALDAALGLLVTAVALPHDDSQGAAITHLRGQIALDQLRATDAVRLLNTASTQFAPHEVDVAREAHLEAIDAAVWVGELDGPHGLRQVASAALQAPSISGEPRTVDLLLDAVATRVGDGSVAAAPKLTAALARVLTANTDARTSPDWLWLMRSKLSALLAPEVWDSNGWHALALRQTQSARDAGALLYLQFALNYLGWTHIQRGELSAADLVVSEDQLIADAIGSPALPYVSLLLAAWRGDDANATAIIHREIEANTAANLGLVIDICWYAKAVLHNGLGRHTDALSCARRAFASDHMGYGAFVAPELAEAAARTGDAATVRTVLKWVSDRATAHPTDWALGIEARLHALIDDDREPWHHRSIEHLSGAGLRIEVGRAYLLYGEWLRRVGRRIDARRQLRTAEETLSAIGAAGFANRARRELSATGETARKRSVDTARNALTNQELHVALLARDGLSNIEIGTRLFISPRTAQYHLGKVFTKLEIRSRGELTHVLNPDAPPAPQPDST